MKSYICYNQYGNMISQLYQWGTNISIVVSGIVPSDGAEIFFHFCNRRSKKAMVIKPAKSDNNYTSPIPNELLMEPDNIFMYIVEVVNSSIRSTRSVIKIPMLPRPMPTDFEFIPTMSLLRDANGLAVVDGKLYLTSNGIPFGSGVQL